MILEAQKWKERIPDKRLLPKCKKKKKYIAEVEQTGNTLVFKDGVMYDRDFTQSCKKYTVILTGIGN